MTDLNNSLPELGQLLEQRLAVVGTLAESLEVEPLGAGAKRRGSDRAGAAHQAELCRQWSQLEDELRLQAGRAPVPRGAIPLPQDLPKRRARRDCGRVGGACGAHPLSDARALVAVAAHANAAWRF